MQTKMVIISLVLFLLIGLAACGDTPFGGDRNTSIRLEQQQDQITTGCGCGAKNNAQGFDRCDCTQQVVSLGDGQGQLVTDCRNVGGELFMFDATSFDTVCEESLAARQEAGCFDAVEGC